MIRGADYLFKLFMKHNTRLNENLGRKSSDELATSELWSKRFNVNFGMSWEDSDKLYVGTFRADGTIEKIDAKSWLESGSGKEEQDRED